jgi:periplasmic copper chaperone A
LSNKRINTKKKILFLGPLCLLIAGMGLGAILPSPVLADIHIENPWIRASTGPNAALFMTLVNTEEKTPEKLISAQIEACAHAELHTHVEEKGVFRMREVEFIEIPAGGSTDLKPGGHHVMLMKIHSPLQEGDEVRVTLSFGKQKGISFTAPVKRVAGECCHKGR